MAYTYSCQSGIDFASKLIKGVPLTSIDETICDMVSSEMWCFAPWFETMTNIPPDSGTLPGITLVDGQQDYNPPPNMLRLIDARIVRTDTTPDEHWEIDVRGHIPVDLVSRSYTAISIVSHERSVGQLRLQSAVQVPSSVTIYLAGNYQLTPNKITSLSQGLWFKDNYLSVFAEGLMYWAYRLADDPRAGGAVTDDRGRMSFTGQYAAFRAALHRMAEAEDFGDTDGIFPEMTLGAGQQPTGLYIFGR